MTVLRAVTEEANELTTNRIRTETTVPVESDRYPSSGIRSTLSERSPEWVGRHSTWCGTSCVNPLTNRKNAPMNVIVCVKQIPDPANPGSLTASSNTLDRSGKLILDESDSYGVEMALQLVDAAGGGEVSLISMAPNNETAGLRTALAMGAAKAILVSDPALQGSDALTTAKVLAAAVQRLGGADLIIAATESSDGYTGTVPEQMAEVLGLPSVTFAKKVAVEGNSLKVNRQTEAGYDEVTCPLPALISVTAGVVEPRYPSFKGIMAAKSKPLEEITASDLGVSPVGWAGAGQQITNVGQAEARAAGEVIEDDGEAFTKIVSFLEGLKVI